MESDSESGRNMICYRNLFTATVFAACFATLATDCVAQPRPSQTALSRRPLNGFLRSYLFRGVAKSDLDTSTKYASAIVDLGPDAKEAIIVYVSGDSMCGSGGCVTLVLRPKKSSYQVIGYVTITRPPIRILDHKTNGMYDIGVLVCGGGIINCYEAALPFNGRRYAGNPTVPPAKPVAGKIVGRTVIQAYGTIRLFPAP